MKKIIFAVAFLVVIAGVSVSEAQAVWFFKKKAETKVETSTSSNSAAIGKFAIKGESSEPKLTIMKKGEALAVIVGGAMVKTNTDGILTVDVKFGTTIVALTVKTTAETKVFRHYDGKGSIVANISVGDLVSFNGTLDTTATSLTVTADKIKDYSMQGAGANYGGVVSNLTITSETDGKVGSFKLPLANQTNKFITVFVSATTKIASTTAKDLKLSDMKNGDFVISARGIANTKNGELRASEIKFSTTGKVTQERMIYNQLAKYDSSQTGCKVIQSLSVDEKQAVKVAFVKTTAGECLMVRINESMMKDGKFTMKNKKKGDYDADMGVFKWMAKEKKSVPTPFNELGLVDGDTVWVTGMNAINSGVVSAYRFEKQVR